MTKSSTAGIGTVLHRIDDLTTRKPMYTAVFGLLQDR